MKTYLFPGLMASAAMACLMADDGGAAAAASKSIVDPKYRKAKNDDFVAAVISKHATKMKDKVTKTPVEGSDPPTFVETTTQVADGVDVDGLFNLAAVNNINVDKFQAQRDGHGFPGRFRMTLANMLRGAARNRHGIFEPGVGKTKAEREPVWVEAPADWLANSKPPAPAEPTHQRDGTKIVKAKPAKAEAEAPVEAQ